MTSRPNIVVLIADDHRFDALGVADHPEVRTPALDGLAERGVRFSRAHCQGGMTGAICAPSRACLMTGADLFDATASAHLDDGELVATINPRLPSLPATLRASGYHTHGVGKWHNGRPSHVAAFDSAAEVFFGGMSDPWAVPLHDFDPTGEYPPEAAKMGDGYSTEIFADAAIQFLTSYQQPDPFFLYVAFTSPHDPRRPPKPYDQMYDPDEVSVPPNFLPSPAFDGGNGDERDEHLTWLPRSRQTVQREMAEYFGMISHLDAQVGRILSTLDETGRAQDTIVVYVSDHGLSVGQHGLLGKQNMYDHSLRIPMLMAGPGLPSGEQVDGLCTLADVFPTLCELSGTAAPTELDGHSLLPLVAGSAESVRDHVFGAYLDVQRMASDGRMKLISYSRTPEGKGTDKTELFDLVSDPWETHDVSDDPAYGDHLARLATALADWQHGSGDPYAHQTAAS